MRFLMILAVLFAGAGVAIYNARAQGSVGALVVTNCGTLPQAYVAGSTRTWTVNTDGQVCQ